MMLKVSEHFRTFYILLINL